MKSFFLKKINAELPIFENDVNIITIRSFLGKGTFIETIMTIFVDHLLLNLSSEIKLIRF